MAMRIVYNSTSIDIDVVESFNYDHVQDRDDRTCSTGIIQSINRYGHFEVTAQCFFQDSAYRKLIGWWSWARLGKVFSAAQNRLLVGNTTLDGAAASGQKNIPLTATAAFTAGDECFIQAIDNDEEFEVVVIASVDAGVKVVAVDNLAYGYTSGDVFRHMRYFPRLKTMDKKFTPKKRGDWWEFQFKFAEDRT